MASSPQTDKSEHVQSRYVDFTLKKKVFSVKKCLFKDDSLGKRDALSTLNLLPELTIVAKKPTTIKDKYTKTQILDHIAEATELTRKDVAAVLDELTNVIEGHIKKRAAGEFVLPGLMKISTVSKPATKARKGINPFTKEEVMFKAKPATTVVKVRPLKKLKEMAL